jgi:hypothetical protein
MPASEHDEADAERANHGRECRAREDAETNQDLEKGQWQQLNGHDAAATARYEACPFAYAVKGHRLASQDEQAANPFRRIRHTQ